MMNFVFLNIVGTTLASTNAAEAVQDAAEETTEQVSMIQEYIDAALPKILAFGIKVVIAALVFFVGSRIIAGIRGHFRKVCKKKGVEKGIAQFIDSILKFVLYFLLVVLILNQFGLTTATVVAILGSSGLTLGLALQGSLANFAGGVLILLQKPFVVGDYIREDTHGNEGTVEKITMIYTTLLTIDHKEVVVPNGTLANSSLINYTGQEQRIVEIKVGISYHADLKTAKEVFRNVAEQCAYRVESEEIKVFVSELSESSVNIGLRFWVKSENYWPAYWETTEKLKLALDDAQIEIPFPQLTISYEQGE